MADKPVIKIGYLKITDHLILGATQSRLAKGEEAFNALTLQTVPMVGWNQVGNALRAGEVDAAFILAPYAMDLFYAGLDIRLILLGHRTGSVLITNKRAHIKTLEDFKGKTIILPLSLSVHHMLLHKLLAEKGLSVGPGKDVSFEVDAPANMPEIIQWDESGKIGGFIVAEPYGSQAVAAGYGEEFALSKDIWPDHPCCVLVMKRELIGKHPDAVQELVSSLVKSGTQIASDPAGAIPVGAAFLGQPEAVVRRVLTEPADRVKTDRLLPTLPDLDMIQTYMTEKIQAMSGKVDLEKLVDPQFAKAAGAR
jgi:NitT/TauT family transport system substrate-binding protein